MFKIIENTNDFVIISKHENVDVHKTYGLSLIDAIRDRLSTNKLYMCHRLDKATSGIMIFAKSKESASMIQTMFENHQIKKTYIALSDQKSIKKNGQIKGDLVSTRNGNYKLLKTTENPSITNFKSILFNNLRVFEIKPITGKTHQIRVVLKSLKSPVIGDTRYNGRIADRLYLHAYKIEFDLNGEYFIYEDIPNFEKLLTHEEILNAIQKLESKWAK